MSDYISRDKVAQAFEDADVDVCEDYGEYYGCEWGFSRDAVRKIVAELPAADVVEVRRGRWIEDERTHPGPGLKNNLCSVCGEIAGSWKEGLEPGRKWAYCPNCGARMGKEDEHEAG